MRKLAFVAAWVVVAGGLNLSVVAPAQAQGDPVAEGLRCGFSSITDPTIENGEVQTGEMDGGPIVATSLGATISIKCTIQVGAANATHAGADSASAQSGASLQTATLSPTLVSYLSPTGQPVYMCTEITVNGETYYYDSNPPGTGAWVQSSASFCSEAISQEIFPGPLAPALAAVPADSVVILSLPGLAEPIHTWAGFSNCDSSWNPAADEYTVTCYSPEFGRAVAQEICTAVGVAAYGPPGGVIGISDCPGISAVAVSPGSSVEFGFGFFPWTCTARGLLAATALGVGAVDCWYA